MTDPRAAACARATEAAILEIEIAQWEATWTATAPCGQCGNEVLVPDRLAGNEGAGLLACSCVEYAFQRRWLLTLGVWWLVSAGIWTVVAVSEGWAWAGFMPGFGIVMAVRSFVRRRRTPRRNETGGLPPKDFL